jgi:hypothetical protein
VDSVAGGITTTFTDNEIIITNNFPSPFNATPFNGPSYLFSGVTVTNVTIDSASSPDFLGVPSFMANDIMVNFSGLSASDGAQLILDVTTTSASALYPEGKNDGSRDQEDGEAGKRTAPARGQAGAAG